MIILSLVTENTNVSVQGGNISFLFLMASFPNSKDDLTFKGLTFVHGITNLGFSKTYFFLVLEGMQDK